MIKFRLIIGINLLLLYKASVLSVAFHLFWFYNTFIKVSEAARLLRIIFTIIACIFRMPVWIFRLYRMSGSRGNYTKEEKYAFLHKIINCILRRGRVTVKCEGLENLPAGGTTDGGYILYPNHQGLFDSLSMVRHFSTPFSIVAKKELESVFMLKNVLFLLGAEFMDRDDIRQSMKIIQNVSKRVKEGENFVIFPEGTRSRNGNSLIEFKAGAFKAASMAHAPIVPVALVDSFIPFDYNSIKKTTVYMYILEPIFYDEYKDLKTTEIADIVKKRIEEKIAGHLSKIPSAAK